MNKALRAIADEFRKQLPTDDLGLLTYKVGEAISILSPDGWGANREDEDYVTWLEELQQILILVKKQQRRKLLKFVQQLEWDNYRNDEDDYSDEKKDDSEDEYWTLGSMFYNKMESIQTVNEKVTIIVAIIQADIKDYLDEVEKWMDGKSAKL